MGVVSRQLDLHVDEAVAVCLRLRRVGDVRRLPGLRVDHGERLQEVVDLVGRHRQGERVPRDARRPLEVRDPVAIDDDATDARRGIGMGDGGVHRASAGHEGGAEDRTAQQNGSHGPFDARGQRSICPIARRAGPVPSSTCLSLWGRAILRWRTARALSGDAAVRGGRARADSDGAVLRRRRAPPLRTAAALRGSGAPADSGDAGLVGRKRRSSG